MLVHRLIRLNWFSACVLAALNAISTAAYAEESPATEPAAKPAMPAGLMPLQDYSGGILERSRLSGDRGGARSDLANKGIQFDVDFEVFYNIALTPATHLTLDVQVADSANGNIDPAVLLGARLNVKF
jgi:hypothetical protein